jgi:hypothetical protein
MKSAWCGSKMAEIRLIWEVRRDDDSFRDSGCATQREKTE